MMDLEQLRIFSRITDLGSISGAARSLGMPKSSVSRALSRLEEAVGSAILERSTRAMRLTDAGRLLYRHARRILDDVIEAENAVAGLTGAPSGTLRVSVGFTFAAGPLAPMLPGFMARYPDVRLVLIVDNRPVDLLTEDVDIAIRIGPLADTDLIARKLAACALWPCASPAYLAARGTPKAIADLGAHTLIEHAERRGPRPMRLPSGETVDLIAPQGSVIPEPAVLKTLLIAGSGIGWLPDFDTVDALADGRLVRVLPDHPVETVDIHALYASHRTLSAKVRAFIDALVEHLPALSRADRGAGVVASARGGRDIVPGRA